MTRSRKILLGTIAAAGVAAALVFAILDRWKTDGPRGDSFAAAAVERDDRAGGAGETSRSQTPAYDTARASTPPTRPSSGTLASRVANPAGPGGNAGALRYDSEYPTIDYAGTPLTGRIGALARRLADGTAALENRPQRGLLQSLLAELDIDVASQIMVFSKTSLQVDSVRPESPRAIYFNDDTYVAYVHGAKSIEIASMDPVLGPVFHTLSRGADGEPALVREDNRCLSCHDSLSLTGGGVPRFLVGSGYIGTEGDLISHEGWILMRPWTPLKNRWGGWYVTGRPGGQAHLGNVVVEDIADLEDVEALRIGNLESLDGVIDTGPYPSPYSDIVALLVVQDQIQVQNDITRTHWDLLQAIGAPAADAETVLAAMPAKELEALLYENTEVLIESLVMAFDVELTEPIAGTSGFTEWFEAQGPHDKQGRSLRELDLQTRIFRYPLSYQLYSDAFAALPVQARRYIYRRLREELNGGGRLELANAYPSADRTAALEILAATKPEFDTEMD